MKKYLPIILMFLCLIVPSVLVVAGNSSEQEQGEEQLEAITGITENLEKSLEEIEKIYKKLEPAQKRVTFDNKVLSFETLDRIEKYEELPKYGLVAPEQYNHKSGKYLVVLALKAMSWFKGNWLMAHGLLGTNMLDVNAYDRSGYQSLFLSLIQRYKMYASYLNDNNISLLTEGIRKPSGSLRSIISIREALIYLVSWQLNARYIYTADGNFGRRYLPERGRKSNEQLKQLLIDGLKVYRQLAEMGFDDKTLKDTLGMAYASLDYDGVYLSYADTRDLGVLQVYSDALTATLNQ